MKKMTATKAMQALPGEQPAGNTTCGDALLHATTAATRSCTHPAIFTKHPVYMDYR